MGKIDEMFKDNEKIIIDTLKQIRNSLYVEENFYEWQVAIDKILDLYNKEKLNSLNLSEQLNKEKEKNIQDMIKDFECSNFIKNNYIHKNKIETLLQDVDNTKFINKHFKGMYLYNNLKCLLEE